MRSCNIDARRDVNANPPPANERRVPLGGLPVACSSVERTFLRTQVAGELAERFEAKPPQEPLLVKGARISVTAPQLLPLEAERTGSLRLACIIDIVNEA